MRDGEIELELVQLTKRKLEQVFICVLSILLIYTVMLESSKGHTRGVKVFHHGIYSCG